MTFFPESVPAVPPRSAQGGTAKTPEFMGLFCKSVPPSHPGPHYPYPNRAAVLWGCAILHFHYQLVKVGWDGWDEPDNHFICSEMRVTPSPRLRWDSVGQVVQTITTNTALTTTHDLPRLPKQT